MRLKGLKKTKVMLESSNEITYPSIIFIVKEIIKETIIKSGNYEPIEMDLTIEQYADLYTNADIVFYDNNVFYKNVKINIIDK